MNAVASGTMLLRWRSLSENVRQDAWKLYGWFTGLMFCGSLFGALHGAFWTQFLINYYEAGILGQTRPIGLKAQEYRLNAYVSRARVNGFAIESLSDSDMALAWCVSFDVSCYLLLSGCFEASCS